MYRLQVAGKKPGASTRLWQQQPNLVIYVCLCPYVCSVERAYKCGGKRQTAWSVLNGTCNAIVDLLDIHPSRMLMWHNDSADKRWWDACKTINQSTKGSNHLQLFRRVQHQSRAHFWSIQFRTAGRGWDIFQNYLAATRWLFIILSRRRYTGTATTALRYDCWVS